MKNRLWFILTILLSITMLNPAFSQTGEEAAEDEAITPGEESTETKTDSTTETTTNEEASSMEAKLWKDPKTGTIFANSAQKFKLTATDDLSKLDYTEYRINNGSYRKYTGPISIPQEGPHSIVYRSIDKAGNVEVDRVYNVVIDNSNPEVQVIPSKPFVKKAGSLYTSPGNSFTIRATDKYSGLKSIKYSVNGTEMKDYQKNDAIKLTENGSQLIKYEAVDNLGNQRVGGTSVLVNVDGSKPKVEIKPSQQLMNVGDKKYAKRATGFIVDATDEGAGIEQVLVKIDGSKEWQTYTDSIFFDTEQPHSIEAKAIDSVGNESNIVRLDFIVDDNPPSTEIEPVASKTTTDSTESTDSSETKTDSTTTEDTKADDSEKTDDSTDTDQ